MDDEYESIRSQKLQSRVEYWKNRRPNPDCIEQQYKAKKRDVELDVKEVINEADNKLTKFCEEKGITFKMERKNTVNLILFSEESIKKKSFEHNLILSYAATPHMRMWGSGYNPAGVDVDITKVSNEVYLFTIYEIMYSNSTVEFGIIKVPEDYTPYFIKTISYYRLQMPARQAYTLQKLESDEVEKMEQEQEKYLRKAERKRVKNINQDDE